MKQIYADFNDIAADGTLPLTCRGSVHSIAMLQGPLHDGDEVLLSDDELRVIARVFRRVDGSWEARSDWTFVRLDEPTNLPSGAEAPIALVDADELDDKSRVELHAAIEASEAELDLGLGVSEQELWTRLRAAR